VTFRYNYNREHNPPAPFVYVTVRCPVTAKELEQVPAQVDTAADRTVLPLATASQLGLAPLRAIPVAGLGGHVLSLPTFRVQIGIYKLPQMVTEVLASPDEPFVLLGRDVLNSYRFLLDGPQLALEIG
jgi:predicted aspartyl protease